MRHSFFNTCRDSRWVSCDGYRHLPVLPSVAPPPWVGASRRILNYHRALAALDESIGRVLQALERRGTLDDTVLVYTSDNGYCFSEHPTLGDKRLMYEESIRVPMIVRYPRAVAAGSVPPELVLNIDVAPTLIDLAGGEVPETMQGRSWRPVFEGRAAGWRASFLYEYFQESWLPGLPTLLGVRTRRWKLCTTPDLEDIPELYDLESDPAETTNLALDPAHAPVLAELTAELGRLDRATRPAR